MGFDCGFDAIRPLDMQGIVPRARGLADRYGLEIRNGGDIIEASLDGRVVFQITPEGMMADSIAYCAAAAARGVTVKNVSVEIERELGLMYR